VASPGDYSYQFGVAVVAAQLGDDMGVRQIKSESH